MKPYSILVFLFVCGCGTSVDSATSEQAFLNTYRNAFENGERDALLRLVKWDGVPDDLRRTQETAYLWFSGKHKITKIEMVPFKLGPEDTQEVDGRPTKLNLEPHYWLLVEHEGNEGFEGSKSTGSVKAPIGVEDGVFFICGAVWDDNQQ